MFRASSAHLQEDTVVYMQHMVLSLSVRVPGGLSVHSFSVCDAKQVYHYKNIKLKLYKNNTAIWFNKTCKAKHLTPTYANIKIKGDNPRCSSHSSCVPTGHH